MGLLLMNLTQGMEVVVAVCEYNYEAMVASTDYKRSRGFKRRVLMDTKRDCDGLQYLNSLQRRYATLDDISADDIAFRDQTATGRAQSGAHLFGELEQEAAVDPGRFSGVKEMGIGEFMDKVLPAAASVEVLLENHHASNMTSLTAPVRYERSIFKWWNGLSWSLADNITGNIRERVQSEGGRADGALRFSIQWIVDHGEAFIAYDPYCMLPNSKEIYGDTDFYEGVHDHDWVTGGMIDVKGHARKDRTPVANMIWPSKWRMMPGIYHLGVRYFPNLGGKNGFKAEIEFGGTIYSFNYSPELYPVVPPVGIVPVADITYNPIKGFSIKELLPSTSTTSTTSRTSSRELWGLRTNYFQPVSVIMDSPLYVVKDPWAGWLSFVAGTGAVSREISRERKWGCFFILKDCVNPEQPGFNTDCLRQELQDYRHLFEVYGNKTPVLNPENQLSGLGFSYKSRDSLIVRVKGDTERILRIRFNATIE